MRTPIVIGILSSKTFIGGLDFSHGTKTQPMLRLSLLLFLENSFHLVEERHLVALFKHCAEGGVVETETRYAKNPVQVEVTNWKFFSTDLISSRMMVFNFALRGHRYIGMGSSAVMIAFSHERVPVSVRSFFSPQNFLHIRDCSRKLLVSFSRDAEIIKENWLVKIQTYAGKWKCC